MTTIFRCSILSILKLERLQIHPVERKILKNDVQIRLRKQQFTLYPAKNCKSSERRLTNVKWKKKLPVSFLVLLTIAILLLGLVIKITFPYPLHASCLVKWNFREPCIHVVHRLRNQILTWSKDRCSGSNCFYEMRGLPFYESNIICASRILSSTNVADEIDIIFVDSSNRSCDALAESKARKWYTLFDHGRNYCNLHNLVNGAGYEVDEHFLEYTNDLICTQYNMAHCS